MNYRHIQIEKREDGYGYIVGDSYLNSIIQKENIIWVPDAFSTENQRWNYETSAWEEFSAEPTPDPEPTQLDRIEEQLNALAADSVTMEKLNAAIAEGVNEV